MYIFIVYFTIKGNLYGGVQKYSDCNNIPSQPICGDKPQDDMRDLCRFSFTHGFRQSNLPVIQSMCQVSCPAELWTATGLHRLDEPNTDNVCQYYEDLSVGGNNIQILYRNDQIYKLIISFESNVHKYILNRLLKHNNGLCKAFLRLARNCPRSIRPEQFSRHPL